MTTTADAATALFDAPAPATPEAAAPAAAPDSSATPAAPAAAQPQATPDASPFELKINDRTHYKTREDAIKGYSELQSRVTQLGPFEVLMKPVNEGGFGLTADQAVAHLDAYAQRLAAEKTQQATPAAGSRSDAATVQAAQQGDKLAYDALTPEWKQHVDYLKKLGYVTQDALQPMQAQLQSLTQAQQESYNAQVSSAVDHGTTLLTDILTKAGFEVEPEMLKEVGSRVGSAIDRDSYDGQGRMIPGSVADKYLRGNEATRREIIEREASVFIKFGDAYKKSKDAAYAASKTAAISQSPRTIPSSNAPTPTARTGRMSSDERARKVTDFLESQRGA